MFAPHHLTRLRAAGVRSLLCVFLCSVVPLACSQQTQAALWLPDAPSYARAAAPAQDQSGTATLSGTVQDANGALIPRAQVTLSTGSQTVVRTTQSDNAGHFALQGIPAGIYKLTIVSPGLETYVSAEFALKPGEQQELPPITLAVATLNSNVQVTATEEQVAEVQIHAEEKQRILGIAPDFYSSYIWDAAPLDAHQKFVLASKSAFDPVAFLSIAAVAGIEQWRNIYPGYHQGAEGYAKRYGASFGDEAIGRFFASAIYPSLFRQDPRYFYKGSGTKTQRAEYAISRAFVTRGNNGKSQPNYSLFLGRLTAGAIANLYHDPSDRGAALTFENAFLNIGGHAFDNLAREFLFKRFTPKVPAFENGEASKGKP
jgi:hypothetical protein